MPYQIKLISYETCTQSLIRLVQDQSAEIVVSNQVIGEAYVALQHHYGVTKLEAHEGLGSVLQSGLVAPQNCQGILDSLATASGCGLLDRLIADDYRRAGVVTLTLDRKMGALPDTRLL